MRIGVFDEDLATKVCWMEGKKIYSYSVISCNVVTRLTSLSANPAVRYYRVVKNISTEVFPAIDPCFPQPMHVHMCPHSSITQSTGLSIQILHKSSSSSLSFSMGRKSIQTCIHVIELMSTFVWSWRKCTDTEQPWAIEIDSMYAYPLLIWCAASKPSPQSWGALASPRPPWSWLCSLPAYPSSALLITPEGLRRY